MSQFYHLFQFLLIFRKAAAGEFAEDTGLFIIYQQMSEIDVDKEGVKGAKNFFEAKVLLANSRHSPMLVYGFASVTDGGPRLTFTKLHFI